MFGFRGKDAEPRRQSGDDAGCAVSGPCSAKLHSREVAPMNVEMERRYLDTKAAPLSVNESAFFQNMATTVRGCSQVKNSIMWCRKITVDEFRRSGACMPNLCRLCHLKYASAFAPDLGPVRRRDPSINIR
jgi:hypothetical protein